MFYFKTIFLFYWYACCDEFYFFFMGRSHIFIGEGHENGAYSDRLCDNQPNFILK